MRLRGQGRRGATWPFCLGFGKGKGLEGTDAGISVLLPGGSYHGHPPTPGWCREIKMILTML